MILPSSNASPPAQRWILALLATAIGLVMAYLLRYVLLPFVIAGGLAYVATPAVNRLQARFHLPRWAAALVPFLILLMAIAAAAWAIRAYIFPEASALIADRRQILEHFLVTLFHGRPLPVGEGKGLTPGHAADLLAQALDSAVAHSDALLYLGAAFGILMTAVLTIVLLFYFLVDGPRIGRGMMWLVPPPLRLQAAVIGRRAGPMIFSYVRGVILVTAYATLFSWIVTRFVLHLPHAFFVALAVGLLELVPVIGPILSIILVCLVAVQQMTFWSIIGVGLFLTGLRLSIDQLVGPLVLGKSVNLPPAMIIFAFMAGGAVYGILGVLVAIPVAAIGKIILEEAYRPESGSMAPAKVGVADAASA